MARNLSFSWSQSSFVAFAVHFEIVTPLVKTIDFFVFFLFLS